MCVAVLGGKGEIVLLFELLLMRCMLCICEVRVLGFCCSMRVVSHSFDSPSADVNSYWCVKYASLQCLCRMYVCAIALLFLL